MGWVAAMILIGFLLPMLGMLYLDILEAKHEVKAQVEKVEKLRRELERKERDDSNNRNPPR
jgi:cell division protein FtsB